MSYIISLTTLPRRYKNLPKVIESMLKQGCPPQKIYIYIPKKNKLPPHRKGTLAHSKIVYRKVDDIGPFTKIYYTLKDPKIKEDQKILVTDDDAVKVKSWAQELLSKMKKNEITSFASIIHGGYGFAFHKNSFNFQKMKFLFYKIPKITRFIDDDFMTLYCVLNQIKINRIGKIPHLNKTECLHRLTKHGLVKQKGHKSRDNLRLIFQNYVLEKYKLYFSLSMKKIKSTKYSTKREKTLSLYNETFG